MTGEVVKFRPKDAAKDPDAVLEQAMGEYADVLILGYDADGNLDARATLGLTVAEIVFLMERFKAGLMNGEYIE